MGTKIVAVYENGVLRPKKKLNLPAGTEVELIIRPSLKGLIKLFEGVEVKKDAESALNETRERKLWE
ncbi:antitoxin family protein [Thermococcus thermotolerans]|uniref:antitoxin family protein n=1 Tax=Thermococcus thermotolerans TaxID=2969672 RepID=UPI002157771D|nr:antitoxin family protein [Thermococcus thermotolerans]